MLRPALPLLGLLALASSTLPAAQWPAWRGPNDDGTSPETGFPTTWSPTSNIRWRIDLPDRGNSSAIVWGDRVFLTQAIEKDGRRLVMAFDRKDGRKLWEAGTTWQIEEKTHEDNPYCAGSPVTDGNVVVATFGSAGAFCFDVNGKELWRQDLGPQEHQWGNGSSPVLGADLVYVYHGPGKASRLVALRRKDGSVAWEVPLPEPVPTERTDGFKGQAPGIVGSFGTPVLVTAGGREELLLGLPDELRAFAPASGHPLWRCGGLTPLVYTTPLAAGGIVYSIGGYFGSTIAVKPGGSGDVTASHRVWRDERSKKNRLGSPVVHAGHLFIINMEGFLECLEAATGRQLWEERLDGPGATDASWSSLTLAGDRLYAVNRSGDSFVVRASPKFEVIAINTVGEPTNSSLAMSERELFLRTWKGLWCISEQKLAVR